MLLLAALLAQSSATLDLSLAPNSFWHGLLRSEAWTLTHNLSAREPISPIAGISAGFSAIWAIDDPDWTMADLWIGASAESRRVRGTLGAVMSLLPQDLFPSIAVDRNSRRELLWGTVAALPHERVTLSLTSLVDIDSRVRGYLEPALAVRLPVWAGVLVPAHSLDLRAAIGLSPSERWLERGLTHVEFEAGFTIGYLGAGPIALWLRPEAHVLRGKDLANGLAWRTRSWFGFSASFTGPRCNRERRICP